MSRTKNLYIANVGDSRLYHITQDKINQVTKDHSVVQELIDLGEISEKEAENHPNKKTSSRARWAQMPMWKPIFLQI
ncbi:MAG: hypothetical protein L6V93_11000 [Clostridiales bacterium]|nr:MAG: hypothetical protein L6V93_11000 [Clostridiales bacterium]